MYCVWKGSGSSVLKEVSGFINERWFVSCLTGDDTSAGSSDVHHSWRMCV